MTAPYSPTAQGAQQLLDQARALLASGGLESAFNSLIEAKSTRQPIAELDTTRALCFLKMGRLDEARAAFREELRHFPTSQTAAVGLRELELLQPSGQAIQHSDAEFATLLGYIRPYTMLSVERLFSLFSQAKRLCQEDVSGNFVECGVAAGGSAALLAYVIKRYSKIPRFLYCFDSFSGMLAADSEHIHPGLAADSAGWGTRTGATSESSLLEVCTKLGVRDVVYPIRGYFEDTIPRQRDWVGIVALLHWNGVKYSSTQVILDNLYDRLQKMGVLQIESYGHSDGCREAVNEFESARHLAFKRSSIDSSGIVILKAEGFPINLEIPRSSVEQFLQDDITNHGIVTQMSENERFQVYSAIRCETPVQSELLRFIEVGSYAGASLLLSYIALRRQARKVQAIAVEPAGQEQFYEIVKSLGGDLLHIKQLSDTGARQIQALYEREQVAADVILIDGDHSYAGVCSDIKNYYPLLRSGGVMIFHDFLPELDANNMPAIYYHHGKSEPGIRRACQELMEQQFGCTVVTLPLLYPADPTQTQAHLPIIPGVFSTIRVYRKP